MEFLKTAQRQSRDGRFFLLSGGSDQLVGSQIARLSSLRVVMLCEVLSSVFDFNSTIVRNVLRGWIAHGDVAVLWITQPLAFSTGGSMSTSERCWFLRGAPQRHDSAVFCALCQQEPCLSVSADGHVCFGLLFRKRFTLLSVNVPTHMKVVRRCDDHGNVCSFSGKAHGQLGSSLKGHFLHRAQRVWLAAFVARALVHQGQLDKQAMLVGLNHGQEHRWGGRGLQCAVIRAESRLIFSIVS